MTNNMANEAVAAAAAGWQTEFCDRYALLLLEYGRWFLLAALVVGVAGALAAVIVSLRPAAPSSPPEGDEAGGSALNSTIEAIKGLIESLSKAPTWLGMLGGALILLWMAGNSVPDYCAASGNETEANAAAPDGNDSAGNEADEAEENVAVNES